MYLSISMGQGPIHFFVENQLFLCSENLRPLYYFMKLPLNLGPEGVGIIFPGGWNFFWGLEQASGGQKNMWATCKKTTKNIIPSKIMNF